MKSELKQQLEKFVIALKDGEDITTFLDENDISGKDGERLIEFVADILQGFLNAPESAQAAIYCLGVNGELNGS